MSTSKRAKAMVEIGASSKGLTSGLSEAKKKVSRFKTDVGRFMREAETKSLKARGGKKGGGGFGAGFVGGLASGALGMVTSAMSETAGEVTDLEDKLARFQIAASRSPEQMGKVRAELDRISKATALNRAEIMDGTAAYVAITGDADGAAAAMESFARIAQASGSQVSDVATAAAALRDNLKLDPADFEKAFSGLIAQGKAGAVEVKDLAGELAALAPQFAKFKNMGGLEGSGELGAAFQVARKGFGSASMAGTGLKSMMTALVQNAEKFEKAGIKIFDKDPRTGAKTMRKFSTIWGDINKSKLVKDPTLLLKAFGRTEALDTFNMFNKFPALYEQLIEAGKDYNTVNRDLATYMASPAGKLKASFNDIKIALAEAFTPERILLFAEAMERVARGAIWALEAVSGLAEFVMNPYGATKKAAKGADYAVNETVKQAEIDPLAAKLSALHEREKGGGRLDAQGRYMSGAAAREALELSAQIHNIKRGYKAIDTATTFKGANPLAAPGGGTPFQAAFGRAQNQNAFFTAMGKALADGLSKASVSVKVGDSAVTNAVDNSRSQRQPQKK